jgi:hypothetical protein
MIFPSRSTIVTREGRDENTNFIDLIVVDVSHYRVESTDNRTIQMINK